MIRLLFLSLLVIYLTACSTQSQKQVKPAFHSANEITKWTNSGRIGIRTIDDAFSGNFNWKHDKDHFEFVISGPFGQGTTKITGSVSPREIESKDPKLKDGQSKENDLQADATTNHNEYNNVVLEYKDEIVTGSDAEAMLNEQLGWSFPFSQIAYWARGIPYPYTDAITVLDEDAPLGGEQTPVQIIQDDWTINYKNYEKVNGLQLPQKLQAEKLPYKVNLIINSWDIE